MKVVWPPEALADLDNIYQYIAAENPAAADRTDFRVLEATSRLEQFPMSGRSGAIEGTRELVVSGTPYIAVYEVHPHMVLILRVIHGSQRWPPID